MLLLSLFVPLHVQSQENPIPSPLAPENALYRDNRVVETLEATFVAAQSRIAGADHGRYNCVQYIKHYFDVSGTFGTGGSNLSLNSEAKPGVAIIFRYGHIAVVTDRTGETLILSEANFHWDNKVTTRVISVYDPSIRGFHSFE